MDEIVDRAKNGDNISIGELVLFMYDLFSKKEKEINLLKKEINDLKVQVQRNEILKTRESIIISNMLNHTKAQASGENSKQTKENVNFVLEELKLKHLQSQCVALRFKYDPKKSSPPPVKITFATLDQKIEFFKALATHKPHSKSDLIKKIRVTDEIPSFLKKDYNKAAKKAYDLRKADKTNKTQIRINARNQTIELFTKEEGQTSYTLHPYD